MDGPKNGVSEEREEGPEPAELLGLGQPEDDFLRPPMSSRFSVRPGGVFVGLCVLFFVVLLVVVVGASLTLSNAAR